MPIVTPNRVTIAEADILSGSPVRAKTWRSVARLNNWTLAGGGELVCGHCPGVTLTAATTYVFKYRTKPRYQALERVWKLQIRGSGGPSDVEVAAPASATAITLHCDASKETALPYEFVEAVSSQSATETELELEIKPTGNNCVVDAVSCWEVPRPELVAYTDDDRGHDNVAFNPRQPITQGPLAAAFTTCEDPSLIGTRPALISWAVPVTAGGSPTTSFTESTSSTSYQDLWSLDIPILLRKLGAVGAVQVKLLAWVTAGTGRFTIRSNDTAYDDETVDFTNTTPAWTSALTNTSIDEEDLSVADGRPSSAWDAVNVGYKQLTTGDVHIAAAWFAEHFP